VPAFETALVACCEALDAAPLDGPDPHAPSSAVAIPSAAAPRLSRVLDAEVIADRMRRNGHEMSLVGAALRVVWLDFVMLDPLFSRVVRATRPPSPMDASTMPSAGLRVALRLRPPHTRAMIAAACASWCAGGSWISSPDTSTVTLLIVPVKVNGALYAGVTAAPAS
jgi:hypothetical protein